MCPPCKLGSILVRKWKGSSLWIFISLYMGIKIRKLFVCSQPAKSSLKMTRIRFKMVDARTLIFFNFWHKRLAYFYSNVLRCSCMHHTNSWDRLESGTDSIRNDHRSDVYMFFVDFSQLDLSCYTYVPNMHKNVHAA